MPHYRAIVHYHFKKGMEEQGLKFCEKELVNKAQELGCHGIELWRNENDPTYVLGIGAWTSLEDARKFHAIWDKKEREILHYCTHAPKREFFQVASTYADKGRRVA